MMRLALACGGGLLLAGCVATTTPPPAASVAVPESFALLETDARAAGTALPALLPREDPALQPLLEMAASAPDLAAALARIDAARASLRGAGAERLPNVEASGTISRERISGARFGGGSGATTSYTGFDLGIDASWDADLFGRLRASERAAAARLDAATADAAAVRLALESDIAQQLIDYRTLARREAVIRADLASAESLVALTRARADAGVVAGFDLVRAQSLEAEARARLEPVARDRAEVIGRLVTLTGEPTARVLAVLAAPAPAAAPSPVPAIATAQLRARPDVRAAEFSLLAADADIAVAAAERYPRFTITAALGLFALAAGDLFDEDAVIGSIGAGLAGPLLDFGRIGARIDQREAEAAEAFASYRAALFTALGETESAIGAIAAIDRQTAALNRQARIDEDALGLARERYRRGLDPLLSVIDAERTSNASREAEIAADGERRRLRVQLYRAVGGAG